MLSKNEIKLHEVKEKRIIRRLAFSETGFIPTIHDYHFDGIRVIEQSLEVNTVTPTQRLAEDDYVLEHITEADGVTQRYELYRYTAGRLRSHSVASNLGSLASIMGKNREISRWLTTPALHHTGPNFINKVFGNRSWYNPDLLRVAMGTLRQLIPSRDLWEGKLGIDIDALLLSFHKLNRLYSKKGIDLNKRNAQKHHGSLDYSEDKVWYFELPRGPMQATLLSAERPAKVGSMVACVSIIGKLTVSDKEDGMSMHDKDIYHIQLLSIEEEAVQETTTAAPL